MADLVYNIAVILGVCCAIRKKCMSSVAMCIRVTGRCYVSLRKPKLFSKVSVQLETF